MDRLKETLARIAPINREWVTRAEARQFRLTKPPGSLGKLEEIANRLCAIQQTPKPRSVGRRVVIFAADHGVTVEGVSAYPSEVTRQMVLNFRAGGAGINALARCANSEVHVVDIGVAGERIEGAHDIRESLTSESEDRRGGAQLFYARVRAGTGNIAREAAMSEAELLAAISVGIERARAAANDGIKVIGLGEMGIGNTTAASAVTAALTDSAPDSVTGRGTGADDETFRRKVLIIERALATNNPDSANPLDVLRKVGGLEIAGLCGLCLGAAAERLAIITDGFIATAGAALAVRLCPPVADYLFAAHLSVEPGHRALLKLIYQEPLLDLGMRLGEGTGAALAMNLVGAAVAAFVEMNTFEAAGISDKLDAPQDASQ